MLPSEEADWSFWIEGRVDLKSCIALWLEFRRDSSELEMASVSSLA